MSTITYPRRWSTTVASSYTVKLIQTAKNTDWITEKIIPIANPEMVISNELYFCLEKTAKERLAKLEALIDETANKLPKPKK